MEYTLLPADRYVVINKTMLNDMDRNIIMNLYGPLLGSLATSLYFTFWSDLGNNDIVSRDLNHHHLMAALKVTIPEIKLARESLEAFGLLKTYAKKGDVNDYVYELYSPLTPQEFFNHPILNIVLYNNVGDKEYDSLKNLYKLPRVDLKDFNDITKKLDEVYDTSKFTLSSDMKDRRNNTIGVVDRINFDEIIASIPEGLLRDKAFTKKTKELINNLAYIYNIDTLKMTELIRSVLTETGTIDKNSLRIAARKDYQFKTGTLPTLVYRVQPEYLKNPLGDNSKKGKIINVFENTSPYDFLRHKNHNTRPSSKELEIIEYLIMELEFTPAVVNVLIDYILKINNNKLNKAYVETVASQWKRANLKTAKEAMEFAAKEYEKSIKKYSTKKVEKSAPKPIWVDKEIKEEELSQEEADELQDLLKEFN